MDEFGFIFTRYVTNEKTNNYWNECVRSIRRHYPKNIIMVIDDGSDPSFTIPFSDGDGSTNIFFVTNEFRHSGEIAAYYYYYKYGRHMFQRAFIIHDSVFLQKPFPEKAFSADTEIMFLWNFGKEFNDRGLENQLIDRLRPEIRARIDEIYPKCGESWDGCFGVMSVITRDFIERLEKNQHIFDILPIVNTRGMRMHTERVFALLCCIEAGYYIPSIFGKIHHYIQWAYQYDAYVNREEHEKKYGDLHVVKVWSGR